MNKTKLLSIVCTLALLFTACGNKTENSRNQSDSSEPVYIHSSRNCYDDGMIYYKIRQCITIMRQGKVHHSAQSQTAVIQFQAVLLI